MTFELFSHVTFVIASQLAEETSFLFFFLNIHLRVYYNMLFPNTKEEDRTGSSKWLCWGKGSEVGRAGGWVASPEAGVIQAAGGPCYLSWLDFPANKRRGLGPFWGTPDARPLGWQKGWEG